MMTLAEKIAEKKRLAALAAQGNTEGDTNESAQGSNAGDNRGDTEQAAIQAKAGSVQASEESSQAPVQVSQEAIAAITAAAVPLVDANGKPLSGFALVKARKEMAAKLAELQKSPPAAPPVASPAPAPVKTESPETAVGGEPVMQSLAEAVKEEIEHSAEYEEAYEKATPETRQAYADVKQRLDSLVSISGDDLRNEMTNLKKALMQNPNAVALMLPSDIGQMVIGLRKMTGVELAAVKEGKKTSTKAKKEMPLTAEQLEQAWEEL